MTVMFKDIDSIISACTESMELTGRVTHSHPPGSLIVYLHINLSHYDKLPKDNAGANTKARQLITRIYSLIKNLLKNSTAAYKTKIASLNLSHTAVSGRVLFGSSSKESKPLLKRICSSLSQVDFTGTQASWTTINRLHELKNLETVLFDSCDKIEWDEAVRESSPIVAKSNLKYLFIRGQAVKEKTVAIIQKCFPHLKQLICTETRLSLPECGYSDALVKSEDFSDEEMGDASTRKEDVQYTKVGTSWHKAPLKEDTSSTSIPKLVLSVWDIHI